MAISTYSELLNFKEKLVSWIEGKVEDENIQQSNYVVFLSYGNIQGEFKHEVRQFQKPYDNQQAEQISLMV